jgi:hypothetical protein
MRRRILATILLSLPPTLAPPPPASAQAPEASTDLGANAAVKYWQAFALLPALDKDQEKLLEEWKKVPLDAAALKLIDASAGSRVYLHRGAKLPRCDWSLDYEDGILLRLPFLPKTLPLARLTALHARHEFERGHGEAGWEDVAALLKMARDVEQTPIMIANLVGYRLESIGIEAACPYLLELKPVLPAAPAFLESPPAAVTLRQLVLKEKQIGPLWLIRELKEAESREAGSWQGLWKEVLSAPGEELQAQDREAIQSAKTFAQAIKMLEDLLPLSDELAEVAGLPWKEFDARYPQFVAKAKASAALAGYLLPSLDRFVAAERRIEAQRAMFKAAVAVVRGGPQALKDLPDPFGDGPFAYRALERGFELKSKLLFKGEPVTLTAGNRN